MPSWTLCLQIIVLLAIAGFGLVVVSNYWLVLALMALAASIPFWLRRPKR